MNSSRPRTLLSLAGLKSGGLRLATLGIAVIALTACAGVNPGSAAVVDGESISMKTVDEASTAYCKLSLSVAAQQGVKTVSSGDSRRQAITDLIMYAVAKKVEKQRGVAVDPTTYVITAAQKTQIAQAFPRADLTQIGDAIERSQETYSIIVALGQASTGRVMADDTKAAIEKAGQADIVKAYKSSDISIDPRFGLNDLTQKIGDTGSLSIAEVAGTEADPSGLPPAQRCS